MNLEEVLQNLKQLRPVFHSEADFQHALAWQIHTNYNTANIRLEYRPTIFDEKAYMDIWMKLNRSNIGIELKYKTHEFRTVIGNQEEFKLTNQSAQDIGRYDFWKDVQRLEALKTKNKIEEGYALFLTNEPLYWNQPKKAHPIDEDFRLHEGRNISSTTLKWKELASKGTTHKRESPIKIKGDYNISWRDYHNFNEKYGMFKYLLLNIK